MLARLKYLLDSVKFLTLVLIVFTASNTFASAGPRVRATLFSKLRNVFSVSAFKYSRILSSYSFRPHAYSFKYNGAQGEYREKQEQGSQRAQRDQREQNRQGYSSFNTNETNNKNYGNSKFRILGIPLLFLADVQDIVLIQEHLQKLQNSKDEEEQAKKLLAEKKKMICMQLISEINKGLSRVDTSEENSVSLDIQSLDKIISQDKSFSLDDCQDIWVSPFSPADKNYKYLDDKVKNAKLRYLPALYRSIFDSYRNAPEEITKLFVYLLKYIPNVNKSFDDNFDLGKSITLLDLAVYYKAYEIIEILKDVAIMNRVDGYGKTPVFKITNQKYPINPGVNQQILKLLKSAGADLDAVDSDGNTVMHKAYQQGDDQLVEALKDLGAKDSIKNKKGQTYDQVIRWWRE